MGELTMIALCQILSNFTHNRCYLVENSNTCRCIGDVSNSISPTVVVSTAPDIMSSEVFLIFFVLAIWLSAIGFCLNQYKSLRRLETQVHYCVNRKDPLNIGDIKIVTREQDSIIYKKKRYSTLLGTHVNHNDLKTLHYVQQYLPKNSVKTMPTTLSTVAINHDNFSDNIPLSTVVGLSSSTNIPLSTHQEINEYQSTIPYFTNDIESNKHIENSSHTCQKETAQYSIGLTIPRIFTPSSLSSSWNDSNLCTISCSTQHLSVPLSSQRSTRLSDGNISLPVPKISEHYTENSNEQLLDPRLIPETVRRSLLALHRESQENVNISKKKGKTRSENDVNGSFTAWKIKMKSKLKRIHHQQQHQTRSHSNTFIISSVGHNNNDQDQHILEHVNTNNESPHSIQSFDHNSTSLTSSIQRNLKYYPSYSAQNTIESDTTQGELPVTTSFFLSTDDESAEILTDTTAKSA
ncbi:unnamed protein product [Rotaria sordida]|uniref:Uncharacterized protein n=1 Tax=Rotaria sordida TaxID=392033 RepID=A0A819CJ30_9BILA|nr:unnamed protein product [Rotaria sordida]